MAENVTRLPVKRETMEPSFTAAWQPSGKSIACSMILVRAFGGRSGGPFLLQNSAGPHAYDAAAS
jgi:hypothetical protein